MSDIEVRMRESLGALASLAAGSIAVVVGTRGAMGALQATPTPLTALGLVVMVLGLAALGFAWSSAHRLWSEAPADWCLRAGLCVLGPTWLTAATVARESSLEVSVGLCLCILASLGFALLPVLFITDASSTPATNSTARQLTEPAVSNPESSQEYAVTASTAPSTATAWATHSETDAISPPGGDDQSPLDPDVGAAPQQRWVRRTDSQHDILEGELRIDFAAGQRQIVLHVPIQPAMASRPAMECEPEDADVSIQIDSVQRYGARLIVRRSGDISEPAQQVVAVQATCESPESMAA